MILVDDRWGSAILSATSTEMEVLESSTPRHQAWRLSCCGLLWNTYLWVCLSGVVDTGSCSGIYVESCTRSQNQGIPGQPGLLQWSGNGIAWFFGLPCEGEPSEGKHKQWDPSSLCSEYLCPRPLGLGLETRREGVCGSDEWQTGPHEEWTTSGRSVWTPVDAVTILLTALGWTWIL